MIRMITALPALSLFLVFAALSVPAVGEVSGGSTEAQVRSVIERFESALAARELAKIEPLVAPEIVVLENGGRNDGWPDFRDNHLVPEMKEPASPSKSEIIKIAATDEMGWGYSKTLLSLTRPTGENVEATLWSAYVVEKRADGWKIALLDWSIRVPKPAPLAPPVK